LAQRGEHLLNLALGIIHILKCVLAIREGSTGSILDVYDHLIMVHIDLNFLMLLYLNLVKLLELSNGQSHMSIKLLLKGNSFQTIQLLAPDRKVLLPLIINLFIMQMFQINIHFILPSEAFKVLLDLCFWARLDILLMILLKLEIVIGVQDFQLILLEILVEI
jgi:hypothetical protein